MPNPSPFIAISAATSSAPTVDCAVNPCSPILKPTGELERKTIYEDIEIRLSGLLPQFASKNVVSLKPPFWYVVAKSTAPTR